MARFTVLDTEIIYTLFVKEYCAAIPVWRLEQSRSECTMLVVFEFDANIVTACF